MSNKTASELLQIAVAIADRMDRRGEPCTPEDALARARAAQLQLQQLKALTSSDWDATVPCPESLMSA